MEFGAATLSSKKVSNGYGVTGKSAYDGAFAAPIKLRATSFSSRLDDYREIFGGSGASLGSSIPILEFPELNERKKNDDVRCSTIDYSNIFGGFGNLDAAVPFEELVAEPKQKESITNGASTRSKAKGGNKSCREDPSNYSKEIPVVLQPSNDAKTINMSYHKVNQGSTNGPNGTTHVAQLHAVPAYTCLIEEVNPVKINVTNKPVPLAQDAYSGSNCNEGIKEAGHFPEAFTGPSSDIAKKQSSNDGLKVKKRSDSVDLFFDACEINNGSKDTHHIKVPPLETTACNLDNNNKNGDTVRSMATKWQASNSAAGSDSPSYLDDMADSNSEAAASVAALTKAIEEAQLRIKYAKESMRRKKEGFPDRVKQKSNIGLKADVKKEAKLATKAMKLEEINEKQTFREMDALPKVSSSDAGKTVMKVEEQVRLDLRAEDMLVAREAAQEAQKKSKSTQAERKVVVEQKEADHKTKVPELKEAKINKALLYPENTGRNASAKPEECDHTIEVVMAHREQENNKEKACAGPCEELVDETKQRYQEKVSAGDEAGACEEFNNETKHRCQEVVDGTKQIHEAPDYGTTDQRLKVNEGGEVENKGTYLPELRDCESNVGGRGLVTGDEKVACKPDGYGKKDEGLFDLEGQNSLRSVQELRHVEKGIVHRQKGNEEEVEVFSELEELTKFVEPIDVEGACSSHGLDSVSSEKEMENVGCGDDRKRINEAGFLDINQEEEHSCQREDTKNTFSDIYVQEILEKVVDHTHYEEEIYERISKDSEFDGNERSQDAKASENELEGTTHLIEDNERGRKDVEEPVAKVIRMTHTDLYYEEIKAEEACRTTENSSNCEQDEAEHLIESHVAHTISDNDEALRVTPKVCSQDDIMVASDASFQHQEKCEEPESVQDTNDFCEKHAVEISASVQGSLDLNEAANQMQNTSETVTFDGAATNIGEAGMKVRQNQNLCLGKLENDHKVAMLVEESTPESVETCKDVSEARDALTEEGDVIQSSSVNEGNLSDNEHNKEAYQIPSMPEWKSRRFKEEEIETNPNNLKENHQASLMVEEKKANSHSRKVEMEKGLLKKIDEAKEREREKEKLAVERVIREARQRAFADARERAAVERAAAEARQKNISDGRERLGKTTSQTNEKTSTEKAAMEAKLRSQRAAVERATAEARARALERALSEKAASEARNKSDKSVADSGMKQHFHSKSFSYGVRDSVDVFDGANCDSAQRCKARSERHQRIGERVAKALAEKNMRDRLVQKEQEERNRIAEALDADVRRWSSGKTGNLRALLSTLQYILGPDSGWQPIPLTDVVTTTAVKKAYRKATLFVHPDKLQQRGASIQQKYICEKVFDLLKEAWNRFNMEER